MKIKSLGIGICMSLFGTFCLGGCSGSSPQPVSRTVTVFDTVVTITVYDKDSEDVLDACVAKCEDYNARFSRTSEGSEIYELNHANGEPVTLLFLIAAPNTEDNVHLEVLSRLSMLLMDEDFRNKLLHAKDVDEFLAYVDAAEKEKFPEEAEEKAEAVIQAWYPGSQGGKALANILFGEVSPSGKLPITFYRTLDELPDFTDYSMKGRTYRYLTEEPLYPFGYGLSYGDVQVEKAEFAKAPEKDQDAEIRITVKNHSEVATRDVVEVYIKNQDSKYAPVNPALCGFAKVSLGAGEEKELTITVSKEAYKVVNDEGEKIFDSSSSILFVGTNGPDKRSEALTGKTTKQLVINW